MKPYFAKYLPVEGEIKVGDLFFSFSGEIVECSSKEGHILYGPKEGFVSTKVGNEKSKKAKLFLCSRNIQVGDEYNVEDVSRNISTWICIKREGEKVYYGDITYDLAGFKTIGEISPEATWVKEGMEFDEDEIQRMVCISNPFGEGSWHKKPLNFKSQLNIRNEYGYTYINDRIEIKCPVCKKFH